MMGAKPCVLIVEDDELMRETLGDELVYSLGIDVVTAPSGRAAMQILERDQVDLVLSDLNMPQGSGLDLVGWIGKQHKDRQPPLILMTGYSRELRASNEIRGVAAIVDKPFEWPTLIATIDGVLAERRRPAA
jgi:CheY-like chemotaxis protein